MNKKILGIIIMLVVIIVMTVIGISISNLFNLKNNTTNSTNEMKIVELYVDENVEDMIAIVPKWEEMSISEQFYEVIYNHSRYLTRKTKISSNDIEKSIESSTLTNGNHNKNADLYSIKNISKTCAIAVKFENDTDYYVYTNVFYKPETLGEFIEDLKLKEIVSFGKIRYNYWNPDSEGKMKYETIEFNDEDDKIIWEMLFSNLDLENIYSDNGKYRSDKYATSIEISVDISLLGYENISVELTDKGYLLTNILDTGKGFYIGEEKVQEFLNYIMENYDGYKIVYIYKNDNETKNEDKKDNENLQVVTHDMINNVDTYYNVTNNTMIDMSIENRTQHNISNSI